MTDHEIAALLRQTIGLKVTSIGKPTLARAVLRRMRALSLHDQDIYVKRLKASAAELRHLIEEVVIPETWFFRDGEPFRAISTYLLTRWAPNHDNRLFRVLSIPCSTGEEPYSIAMALLSSGWPPDKFTVHGVDISYRSILRAKEAAYTNHSFRGADLTYRARYFQKNQKYYTLKKEVRDKVHFHTGNILNESFMQGLGGFDIIFSRNVLIYFDPRSCKRALDNLYKILHEDGILFVGHAEANLLSSFPFTPAPYPQAFAFYKKPDHPRTSAVNQRTGPGKKPAGPAPPDVGKLFQNQRQTEREMPDLGLARQLANTGDLRQASMICREYLERCGPAAQALFLLGLIHDAADDGMEAEKLFRQALYLDPKHVEALVFLTLLAEQRGDAVEARSLRRRLERLQQEKAAPETTGVRARN